MTNMHILICFFTLKTKKLQTLLQDNQACLAADSLAAVVFASDWLCDVSNLCAIESQIFLGSAAIQGGL